jgi:hypothetical protein
MFRNKLFALLFGVLIMTGFAFAQPGPPSKKEKLDFLIKKLELNEQQIKAIDQVLTSTQKQLDQLCEKRRDFNDQSMKETKQVFDNEDLQIEKTLTDSQKRILAELKKERENHRPPMGPPQDQRDNMRQGPPPPVR